MCPREASCRRRAELWRIRPHAFKQQFDLKDVHFVVDATNEGSLNQLTITSTGLNESAAGFPTPANTHLCLHQPVRRLTACNEACYARSSLMSANGTKPTLRSDLAMSASDPKRTS